MVVSDFSQWGSNQRKWHKTCWSLVFANSNRSQYIGKSILALVISISSWLVWVEIMCSVHVALPIHSKDSWISLYQFSKSDSKRQELTVLIYLLCKRCWKVTDGHGLEFNPLAWLSSQNENLNWCVCVSQSTDCCFTFASWHSFFYLWSGVKIAQVIQFYFA